MKQILRSLTGDIRFWIIIFFLIRMYGITLPPLEAGHSWRQASVNMVARNFYEVDPDIFYPRVDMAGDKTGITGMEFPLLNYLIYLVSLIFGFTHWHGRLINLIVSSAGIYFFYLIVKKYLHPQIAFYASLLLLTSIWLSYSRKIMPDTFSVSLVLAGLYFCLEYLYKKGWWKIFLFMILTGMGILSKIPAIILLSVLIISFFDNKVSRRKKLVLVICSLSILISVVYWYLHWVPYLVDTYAYWHFYMGTSLSDGLNEVLTHWKGTAEKFYFESFYSFLAFILFIAGLILAFIRKEKILILIFIISFLAFSFIIIKAGYTFTRHNYYIVPFVPVMSLFGAYALLRIKLNWVRNLVLFFVIVECLINQQHDFRVKKEYKHLAGLEAIADKVSGRNDLILINGGYELLDIYYSHRKGWSMDNLEIFNTDILKDVTNRGCKYLFIDKHKIEGDIPEIDYEVVYDDVDFRVYGLESSLQ